MWRCLGMLSLVGIVVVTTAAAGDWPAFLGPHGTGVSDETNLAAAWPADGPPRLWSRAVGEGYSAPSVLGDRLVIHHRVRDEEVVECLDAATGESRWRHAYSTAYSDPYGYNGGPRATPTLTADRCFSYGAAGTLCCLNLQTGQQLWRRDVQQDFQIPEAFFGIGTSPVLYESLVICLVGGQPDAAVVAFDAVTGKTVWHAGGKPTWDGADTGRQPYVWTGKEMLVSYSTPTLARFHGQPHLLCLVRQGLLSLDPASGAERFHYWFRSPVHESVNAARPVVFDGDKILLTAAYRAGMAVLQVQQDGQFRELLRPAGGLECHWSTPIVQDGYAYGFSGRHESEATLRCINLTTGDLLWQTDGSEAVRGTIAPDPRGRKYVDKATGNAVPWPYFGRGSLTAADGRCYLLGERGTLALATLSPAGYTEISRTAVADIDYPAWAAPALSNGRLYLRDEDTLSCLNVAAP